MKVLLLLWLPILFAIFLTMPALANLIEPPQKLTPAERDAIKKPKEGMVVYVVRQKNPSQLMVYMEGKWRSIEEAGAILEFMRVRGIPKRHTSKTQ